MEKAKAKSFSLSDSLALIALIISIASIYFSVFFKKHDLTLSIIDSNVEFNENKISVKLLYHNQGNTYSTIIQNYLIFYQTDDWANEGIVFNKEIILNDYESDPIILVPEEQVLNNIETIINFSNIDSFKRQIDIRNKINVGIVSMYINKNGLRTSNMFPIGYILLDKDKKIDKYSLDYHVFELNDDGYFSNVTNE
jgi:hypothetical protein